MVFVTLMTGVALATDGDGDGLEDEWEMVHFGHLRFRGGDDPDQDRVTNQLEAAAGLNPLLAETVAGKADWYGVPGALRMEKWNGIPGIELAALYASPAFPGRPSVAGLVSSAGLLPNQGDQYGVRLRGWLRAPVSGDYRFYVASDDQARVFLGRDESRFSTRLICRVDGWTAYRDYTATAEQASGLIRLEAGESYFFEVHFKEAYSGDHLSVAWTIPGQSGIEEIPGRLANGTVILTSDAPDAGDQDDDGNEDAWEVAEGLNPASAADHAWTDVDGDGFDQFLEYRTGGRAKGVGGNRGYVEWSGYAIGANGGRVSSLTGHPCLAMDQAYAKRCLPLFEAVSNPASAMGARIRGVITIPVTGRYTFYLASDDAGVLWMNPDGASRFGKRKVAQCPKWVGIRQYQVQASQRSATYDLQAGQQIYVEALHVDLGGVGHVSVAWTGPGWAVPVVVPGEVLSVCEPEFDMRGGKWVDLDTDGDSLPDDWELAHGLVVGTGSFQAVKNGEYGDPDGDGLTNFEEYRGGSHPLMATGTEGKWVEESYADLSGSRVVHLIGAQGILRGADEKRWVGSPGERVNVGDWYGRRFRAVLKAPVSGDYRFWVCGDDGVELWVSTDERKFRKRRVALVDDLTGNFSFSGVRDWNKTPGQRSGVIRMEKGKKYFVEMLHAEGGGEDHCEVAWSFASHAGMDEYVPVKRPTNGVMFPGVLLDDVVGVSGAIKWNGLSGEVAAKGACLVRSGGKMTVQLQAFVGGYTRMAKLCLEETAEGLRVYQVEAKGKEGNHVGRDFDHLDGTWQTSLGAAGHGVTGLTLLGGEGPLAALVDEIGSESVVSYAGDAEDLDDDYLPDAWEESYLGSGASMDNGLKDPGCGEYGDPDQDSIINREEWLLGTDPMKADTDGDGYDDGQEVFFLGTNPLVAELDRPAVVGKVDLNTYAKASGTWVPTTDGGMLSMQNRGWIDYEVTVSVAGYYLYEICGRARGSSILGREDFPLEVRVDSRRVGETVLTSLRGRQGLAAGYAGWLNAGKHTIRVWNENLLARRTLQLDSIRLLLPAGESSHAAGLPDWVYDFLARRSVVTSGGGSFTSPFCVEGISRDAAATWVSLDGSSAVAVNRGTGDGWYVDVPLDSERALGVKVHFENGVLVEDLSLEWLPFNVANGVPQAIRVGDRMRLTGFVPGGVADASTVELKVNGRVIGTTSANRPLVYEFGQVGLSVVEARYRDGSEWKTASVEIQVVGADLGPVCPVYLNRSRFWDLPGLPMEVPVEADRSVLLSGRSRLGSGSRYAVDVDRVGTSMVLARTEAGGAVVDAARVEGILLGHSSNYELPVLQEYANGDRVVELTVFATQLPPGGYVRLEVWLGGRLFLPAGTMSVKLSAEDFGDSGIAKVRMLLSSGIGTTCHRMYLHAGDGTLIGQM